MKREIEEKVEERCKRCFGTKHIVSCMKINKVIVYVDINSNSREKNYIGVGNKLIK